MILSQRTLQVRNNQRRMSVVLTALAFLTLLAQPACGQRSTAARPGEAFDIEVPGLGAGGFDLSILVKGAVTIRGKDEAILLNCERVGDRVCVDAPVGGKGRAQVAPAKEKGTEVRYAGTGTINGMSFEVPPGHRLCFRKSEEGWVYICGKGSLSGSVHAVFGPPDAQAVLNLLASESPFEREGGARNIHLLSEMPAEHLAAIMVQLRKLLADADLVLFAAGAEGLAYIGSDSAYRALIEAREVAPTEEHKAIVAECLALLAVRKLFLGVGSVSLNDPDGARLVLAVEKPWVKDYVAERLRGELQVRERLSGFVKHASSDVRKLALEVQSRASGLGQKQNLSPTARIQPGSWEGKATNGEMWTQIRFVVHPDNKEVRDFKFTLGFEPEEDGSLEIALEDSGLIDEDGAFDVVKKGRSYVKGRFVSSTQAEGHALAPDGLF